MKVYFVYEGKDTNGSVVDDSLREVYKVKIDLPAKWLTGPCEQLFRFIVATYNKKNPKKPLVVEEISLWNGNVELKPSDIVETRVHEYNDVHIRHVAKSVQQLQHPGSVPCTNYGCGKYFLPEENNDTACKHHAEPPIFHDIEKYWRCCPTRRVRDWDDFNAIPPCCTGPHSTENRQVSFTSAPTVNVPLSQEQLKATEAAASAAWTSVQDGLVPRRTTGPREFEGAVAAQGQSPQEIIDGKAKCRNYGCQQEFVVSENNSTACRYHSGGPVFWDTYKYWKCCPDKKCYEFDDFVKIPGCSVGPHQL
ncbi:CHORD domain [Trypanosoma melophagium]|uniref:CHORD domain n=1 Tax=Trypanosoma melophagium TaxID=715481 RepID=UPI00351A261A|nr:CHORD domain [Trypanosoma melophagium]